jgi:O-antigen biosynthesis protein WbqP
MTSDLTPLPGSTPAPIAPDALHLALKRALDVAAAGAGLLLLAPLLAAVALTVRLDSPGPVLFRQRRVGRHQVHFEMVKFRTMRVGTPDLPTDQMQQLPSPITRVGQVLRRTSLDELPQLWNVLKGEMSLVGPRPALYNQDDLIAERERAGVHALPPGITGWAQINGRDELAVPEKVAADRWYLAHFSLWLDLRILLGTFVSLGSKRGVN